MPNFFKLALGTQATPQNHTSLLHNANKHDIIKMLINEYYIKMLVMRQLPFSTASMIQVERPHIHIYIWESQEAAAASIRHVYQSTQYVHRVHAMSMQISIRDIPTTLNIRPSYFSARVKPQQNSQVKQWGQICTYPFGIGGQLSF